MSVNVKLAVFQELKTALANIDMALNDAHELAREQLKECAQRLWKLHEETESSCERFVLDRAHGAIFYDLLPITRAWKHFGTKKKAFNYAVRAIGIPFYLAKTLPDKDDSHEVDQALKELRRYFDGNSETFDE